MNHTIAPEHKSESENSSNYKDYLEKVSDMSPEDRDLLDHLLEKNTGEDRYKKSWKEFHEITREVRDEVKTESRRLSNRKAVIDPLASLLSAYVVIKFLETSTDIFHFNFVHLILIAISFYTFFFRKIAPIKYVL